MAGATAPAIVVGELALPLRAQQTAGRLVPLAADSPSVLLILESITIEVGPHVSQDHSLST